MFASADGSEAVCPVGSAVPGGLLSYPCLFFTHRTKIEKEKKEHAKLHGMIRTEISGAEIAEEMEKERRFFQLQMCEVRPWEGKGGQAGHGRRPPLQCGLLTETRDFPDS